jgi:hypothetical protein
MGFILPASIENKTVKEGIHGDEMRYAVKWF